MKELPITNFGISTNSTPESEKVGEMVKKYYPDYNRSASFNGSSNNLYHIYKNSSGEYIWMHRSWRIGQTLPPGVTEVLTLEEFTKKYLTKPEVINDYQIY